MKPTTFLNVLTGCALSLGLAACGGGSSDSSAGSSLATPDTVPPGAVSSTQSFVDYLNGQSPANDTIEPLTLQQMLPPTSDTTEPTPLS
jgi:hypothetical protein